MPDATARPFDGGPWPTPEQTLLLRAALAQDSGEALAALRAWQAVVDFEAIEGASQKLLPLVHHNLSRHGLNDPVMGRMKGHYRLTWYQNQALFHGVAPVLRALAAAGIATLTMKGAALALQYYADAGLRPMLDFDLLAPFDAATAAIAVLREHGWRAAPELKARLKPAHLAVTNGFGFDNGRGHAIDLHWHVLPECCYERADDLFWQDATPVEVAGAPTLALGPTALLLHICLHGYKWNRIPPMRWVADAITVLRAAGPQIDWPRLADMAAALRLVLPLRATLAYLHQVMQAPVPPDILARLHEMPVSGMEQREFKALTRPLSLAGLLAMHWARHSRRQGEAAALARLASFPGYVQQGLGLERAWQAPVVVGREVMRRLRLKGAGAGR